MQLLEAIEKFGEIVDSNNIKWSMGETPRPDDFEAMWEPRKRVWDIAVMLQRKYEP